MKRQDVGAYPGARVYFTLADSSAQQLYGIGETDLAAMLKLSLLLNHHVILSAGHMLRSELTYSWLQKNQASVAALASQGALLVSISDRYTSFREFAQDQVSDGTASVGVAGKPFFQPASERARILDDLFPLAIGWQSTDESTIFKYLMTTHLRDKGSPLRKRLVGLHADAIAELGDRIEATDEFRRGHLFDLTSGYATNHRNTITRYGDCFYYLSGARTKDAFPLLHAQGALLLQEQVSHVARSVGLCPSDSELWRAFLEEWGVSSTGLARLRMLDVLEVRESVVGKKARDTYERLLTAAARGKADKEMAITFRESQVRLFELLYSEVATQEQKHQWWDTGRRRITNTSYVTGWAALAASIGHILNPVAAGAISLVRLMAGMPVHGALERKFGHTELVLLAGEIKRRSKGLRFVS